MAVMGVSGECGGVGREERGWCRINVIIIVTQTDGGDNGRVLGVLT